MTVVDFDALDEPLQDCEALIVGCGAAGIFLASRLIDQGRSVVLLESGEYREVDAFQELNSIRQTAKRQSNPIWNRKRMLGGTTTAWGGQSLPFTPLDLSSRSWMPSEWPISYGELAEHYREANRFMGIDLLNYESDISRITGVVDPGFSSDRINYHFSKWAPQPNFFSLKRRLFASKRCLVLYHAHCVALSWHKNGAVEAVQVVSSIDHSKRRRISARAVFLATGGIESTRMLLLSSLDPESPLADASSVLGLGYMDHPCMQVAELDARSPRQLLRLQKQFGTQLHGRRKYSVRMSASDSWQIRNQLPNISSSLIFLPHPKDDWLLNLKALLKQPSLSGFIAVLRLSPSLLAGFWMVFVHRIIFRGNARAVLCVMAEQPADPSSRIVLDDSVDSFGLRRARLHWTIHPVVGRAIRQFASDLKDEFERLGFCTVRLSPVLSSSDEEILSHTTDVNHHMGGARMSSSPEHGVVDPWLRPWGAKNLFVCSAAVFPTSSHSNPTLTLLALCSRLVERLASFKTFEDLLSGMC